MRIKKIVPLVAALGMAAAAVTACGGGGKTSSSAGSSDAGTTITYWASNQGTSLRNDQQVLAPELAKFTKQTGIKVKLEVVSWTDLLNRILAAATSGKGPDVVNIGNTWSASLQATGAFVPFDSANLAKIGGAGQFLGPSLKATGAAGQSPVGVPLYGNAYGLYYNKKMFAAAGITAPPTTWPELVADGKKLTTGGHYGLTLQAGQVTENAHFASILGYQQGAQLFDSGGKPQLDSPQEVAAVKQYVDLMATDKIVNPSDAEYTDTTSSLKDVAAGKVAMFMNQASAGSWKTVGMDMSNLGVAPIPFPDPAPAGGQHVNSFVAGINISVFKSSKNQDAALKFVKFMTSTPEETLLNKTYGSLPTVNAAYSDPAFATPDVKVFQQVLSATSAPMPEVAQESQFETAIGTALKNIFTQAATGKPVTDDYIAGQLKSANQQLAAAG